MSITEEDLMRIYINRISYNYPDIPKIAESGGSEDAAGRFAEIFGLAESEGSAFFARLDNIHRAVRREQILSSAEAATADIPAQFLGELRKGSSGNSVKLLQKWLHGAGMYFPGISPPEISGTFDDATESAVKGVQKVLSLPVTGRSDRLTWNGAYRLFSAAHRNDLPDVPPYTSDLKEGMTGEQVRLLQEYINHIHRYLGHPPVLDETGRFGSVTAKETAELQKLLGLPANGVVDKNTWDGISMLYLDTVIGGTKQPGQFPGEILSEEIR